MSLRFEARADGEAVCGSALAELPDGRPYDPSLVNLRFPDAGGVLIGRVNAANECDEVLGGWYFDDSEQPTEVHLCSSSCADARRGGVLLTYDCPQYWAEPARAIHDAARDVQSLSDRFIRAGCENPDNPLFGSCLDDLVSSSCWAPDVTGTCSVNDGGTTLTWADGHSTSFVEPANPFLSRSAVAFENPAGATCFEWVIYPEYRAGPGNYFESDTAVAYILVDADGTLQVLCGDDGLSATGAELE
jgi:hypothetical protein